MSAFGYLGDAHAPFEPFGMGHEGSAGYHEGMGQIVNVFEVDNLNAYKK